MNGNSPTVGCDTGLLARAGSCAISTQADRGLQVTAASHIFHKFLPGDQAEQVSR